MSRKWQATPRVAEVLQGEIPLGELTLKGWVKTHRRSKRVAFIELSDGSSVKGVQLVLDPTLAEYEANASKVHTGASIVVSGTLVESPAKGQDYEFQVSALEVIGEADPEIYPLQKKGHTLEFLRESLHLRPRSNTLGAVFRLRSKLAFATHRFFQEKKFVYLQSPIITTSDCEGAGEMFQVTTLDLKSVPTADGRVDFSGDFFGERASLTVSGQLEAEAFALAFRDVYTFGPTFRAENSNTTRHLSEFWMIEPEMAFCTLEGDMALAEEFVAYLVSYALNECQDELAFLHGREWVDEGLRGALESVATSTYEVLEYTEAIKVLEKASVKFEYPVSWGMDLQTEHERYLTEQHVGSPVFVINYPKEIKAFYMRLNEDGKTVRALDLLVPRLGEIVGGSEREEREGVLREKIKTQGIPEEELEWYLELRRFGGTPHAGFGLGFERLIMYVSGMMNIRDVAGWPRFPGFAR